MNAASQEGSAHSKRPSRTAILAGAVTLLAMVVLWTAIETLVRLERRSSEEAARSITTTLARLFEDQVARIMRQVDLTLVSMRADLQFRQEAFNLAEWYRSRRGSEDLITHMAVIDAEGRTTHATAGPRAIGVDVSDRAHFRFLRDQIFDQLLITEPTLSRITGQWSIQAMRRIYAPDGRFDGIVQISIDPEALSRFYDSVAMASNGSIALLRADGIRLARGPTAHQLLGQRVSDLEPIAAALRAPDEAHIVTETNPADGNRLSAYRAVPGFPMVVRVSLNEQAVYADLANTHWFYRMTGIVCTILLILTGFLVALLAGAGERARRETDRVLQEAIDAIPDGFVVYDTQDRLHLCNAAYRRLYKDSAEVIQKGRTFEDILRYGLVRGQYPEAGDTPEDRERWLAARMAAHRAADGRHLVQALTDRWVRISETRTTSGLIVGVRADVTSVRLLEQDLASKAGAVRRLAQITEITTNEVIITDLERRITWANPAFCQAFDTTLEQVVGRYPAEILRLPPDAVPDAVDARARALAGENVRFEQPRVAPDGSLRWASVVMSPIRDDQGAIVGVVSVATDITERKRHEQMIEDYSKDLERFAHVASHDLQEPLRKIATHARLLAMAVDQNDADEVERCIGILVGSAQRGRNIVTDLLRYAKLKDQPVQRTTADLAAIIGDIADQLQDTAGQAKTIIDNRLPSLPARFDPGLVTQVFQNVIGNAAKYRKKGQAVTITIDAVAEPEQERLRIRVADDGIGFDMQYRDEIFQPFKRLVSRSEYQGTGIGLSLVRSILDKHAWDCDIVGTPGAGTTFSILIPFRDLVEPATSVAA